MLRACGLAPQRAAGLALRRRPQRCWVLNANPAWGASCTVLCSYSDDVPDSVEYEHVQVGPGEPHAAC